MPDMKWWQELVDRATDNELEQCVSALGDPTGDEAPRTVGGQMLEHMVQVALRELGRRSKGVRR